MFDPTTRDAPYAIVVAALWVIVMLRANATYWLGRGIAAGARRTKAAKLLDSRHYERGASWLNRWGAPAVSLSFFTIGIQTMVNLAAGVTRMPLRRYLPAVISGSVIWAFLYGTVGFIGWAAVVRLWQMSPPLVIVVGVLGVGALVWAVACRDTPTKVAAE